MMISFILQQLNLVSIRSSLLSQTKLSQSRYLATTIAVINPRSRNNNHNDKDDDNKIKKKKSSKYRKQGNASSYKFVDKARVKVLGGNGGKGCISYESKLGSKYKKRPDGGHGGNGGCVILVADVNEQSLNMSTHHFKAEDGVNGTSRECHGRNGKNKIIRVPCGVVVKRVLGYDEVWDQEEGLVRKVNLADDEYVYDDYPENDYLDSDMSSSLDKGGDIPRDFEEIVNKGIKSEDDGMYHWKQDNDNSAFLNMGQGIYDDELSSSSSDYIDNFVEREKVIIADLDKAGSYAVVANGGRGGIGNSAYAKRQFVPHLISKATSKAKGFPGDEVYLELELKLIADIGLVGYPNAGKSSLLAAMSKAKPEIAPYPFTTLHPLVGCIEYRDGFRALMADVPGLIDGAAEGRGRGHDFLRHLERTKALMYVIDAAGVDGRCPLDDLRALIDEIQSYGNGDMMTRPALIVANKLDLILDSQMREEIYLSLNEIAQSKGVICHRDVQGISAGVTGEGLGPLSKSIRDLIELGEKQRMMRNDASSSSFV